MFISCKISIFVSTVLENKLVVQHWRRKKIMGDNIYAIRSYGEIHGKFRLISQVLLIIINYLTFCNRERQSY